MVGSNPREVNDGAEDHSPLIIPRWGWNFAPELQPFNEHLPK